MAAIITKENNDARLPETGVALEHTQKHKIARVKLAFKCTANPNIQPQQLNIRLTKIDNA